MPPSETHSRPSGDITARFNHFGKATALLFSVVLCVTIFEAHQNAGQNSGSLTPVSAASWATNVNLRSVDLFTLTSLSDNNRKKTSELNAVDALIYSRIFESQHKGDWNQANALIKRIHNPLLMGHVLYDRYIQSQDYRASYAELRDWMVKYGDHPQAYRIYQLAQKRRNNDPAALPAPQMAKKLFGSLELSWFLKKAQDRKASPKPIKRDEATVTELMSTIKARLNDGKITGAYDTLGKSKASRMLTAIEYDSLLGEIAAGYYYNDKKDTALRLAEQATNRSGNAVPVAHWIAGLSAWKKADYKKSAKHFESIANSQSRNPWMLSAGAFWAARSYHKLDDSDKRDEWLQEAANYPRTFYGLISKAKLGGSDEPFSWAAPQLTRSLTTAMQEVPSARRALALLDVGQTVLAQQELMQVHPNGNATLEKALIATANNYNLPELAMRLGNAINQPDGKLYDVALYPIVPWKGDTSVNVDPALINALIRQESQFDANASNRSGAKGLMQLMPSTAQLVSDTSFDAKDIHNPEVNVALGQRYVRYLLKMPHIKGNLLYLAAAYNAGPGNLMSWQKNVEYKNDPFLFIESIPYSETRAFVARVMTNYWIYGQRMEQETATLDSLGKEKWPVYNLSDDSVKMASVF